MSWREVKGNEFDWFAVDKCGYVGHFATAGYGPIPVAVLDRLNKILELYERVLQMPVVGEATGHLPGRIESWLEMARRGLFAYDWKHWHGPYQRAATPSHPVRLVDLPADLREAVQVVTWPNANFVELLAVRPEEMCPCK
jgi:hypothetical protein